MTYASLAATPRRSLLSSAPRRLLHSLLGTRRRSLGLPTNSRLRRDIGLPEDPDVEARRTLLCTLIVGLR